MRSLEACGQAARDTPAVGVRDVIEHGEADKLLDRDVEPCRFLFERLPSKLAEMHLQASLAVDVLVLPRG